jgi:hypothetical protein
MKAIDHNTLTEYYTKLFLLEKNKVEEVKDFIDFLLSKQESEQVKRKPVFGSGKGTFEIMLNFDEPLDLSNDNN